MHVSRAGRTGIIIFYLLRSHLMTLLCRHNDFSLFQIRDKGNLDKEWRKYNKSNTIKISFIVINSSTYHNAKIMSSSLGGQIQLINTVTIKFKTTFYCFTSPDCWEICKVPSSTTLSGSWLLLVQRWANNIILWWWVCFLQWHVRSVLLVWFHLFSCVPLERRKSETWCVAWKSPLHWQSLQSIKWWCSNIPKEDHADYTDETHNERHNSDGPGKHCTWPMLIY